jgi:hypothetical protein
MSCNDKLRYPIHVITVLIIELLQNQLYTVTKAKRDTTAQHK